VRALRNGHLIRPVGQRRPCPCRRGADSLPRFRGRRDKTARVISLVVRLTLLLLMGWSGFAWSEATAQEFSADERDSETLAAQRFLQVLLRNPRPGTAFERVYSYHLDRGSIAAFRETLRAAAKLPNDAATEAGNPTAPPVALTLPNSVDSSAACLLVGLIDLRHAESESAVQALQQAATLRPDDAISHWSLARAYAGAQKPDEARAAFENAIACHPAKIDLLEIYKDLARLLQRTGKTDDALQVWKRVEDEFPGDLRVLEQIAATLATEGRWDEALSRYQSLAELTRNDDQRIQASLAASDLLVQLGRTQEAVTLLESQLTNLDPDGWLFREVRQRIEGLFRSRDDVDGLVKYYEARVKSHSEDVDAMARLARTLAIANRSSEASDWYRRAIERAPSNVSLRELLIKQLVRDQRIPEALQQYQELSEFAVENPDHLEDWGLLLLSQKDRPTSERQLAAADVWDRILKDRPDDPTTLVRVAGLMRRADLQDRALALFRAAIEKAPDQPQYREYLGEYLQQLNRTDEAIAVWSQMAVGERSTRPNLIRLAEVLHRFGHHQPALQAMRDACQQNPEIADRLQFAEMLRSTFESLPSNDPTGNRAATGTGSALDDPRSLSPLLSEALEQLDVAQQAARTSEEASLILRERVQWLMAAGQLDREIQRLSAELEAGTNATANRWRTLAVYQEAAQQWNAAATSAQKVVELEPMSVAGWTLLADLCERSGRLGDAAAALQTLAKIDRRGFADYLRRTARIQVRLGQFDAALETGRELTRATPGNPDAWQNFADLAFEVGQPVAAVEALRQAVRVNPGDEASLRALAKTLAEEFQTSEAIELYWRAFEKAADLDSQTQIVAALSNLALRSQQFGRLIERLELRSRELNLPTEMTRCLATAYREAGDFRRARHLLESLLAETPDNVDLLRELLALAEAEGNGLSQEDYQRQLLEISGTDDDLQRLVVILKENGRREEATQLVRKAALAKQDPESVFAEVQRLMEAGDSAIGQELCQQYLAQHPDDWRIMDLLREIHRREEAFEEERAISRRLMALKLDFDTTAPSQTRDQETRGGHMSVSISASEISDWLKAIGEGPSQNFGVAYCRAAAAVVFSEEHPLTAADISAVLTARSSESDRLRLTAFLLQEDSARAKRSGQLADAVESLLKETSGTAARALRLKLLCLTVSDKGQGTQTSSSRQNLAGTLLRELMTEDPQWLTEQILSDDVLLPLVRADAELAASIEHQVLAATDSATLSRLWRIALRLDRPDLLLRILTNLRQRFAQDVSLALAFDEIFPPSETTVFAASLPTDFPSQLAVLDCLRFAAASPARDQAPSADRSSWQTQVLMRKHFGGWAGANILQTLHTLAESGAAAELRGWLKLQLESANGRMASGLFLLSAEMSRITGEDSAEFLSLIQAAEQDRSNLSLRFAVAGRAAQTEFYPEAIAVLDSHNLTDPALQIARETLLLDVLPTSDFADRRRLAAERLFGLPLGLNQQRRLVSVVEQLNLPDRVQALQARLGRGAETRQSELARRLQTWESQGKTDLAAEAAWELLKLASGGTLFSGHRPNDDRDDGGERLLAIKALGRLNRLQPLIDRYEAMLNVSPKSLDLLEILCEFHEASGQFGPLAEKRDRIALLSKKAPPGLKAKAVALENSGDVSGACDIYLQILQEDPEAFADEMETFVQAFERAKRRGDFLTAVLNQEAAIWSDHAALMVNVTADLARAGTHPDVVQRLLAALLNHPNTRRLAVGGFLARPDVASEEQLLPSLLQEILADDLLSDAVRWNELFLILQGLKTETSLRTLQTFFRDPKIQQQLGPAGALMRVYLEARLGQENEAENQLSTFFATAVSAKDAAGAATLTPRGSDIPPYAVLTLNTRLKELGPDWNPLRRELLESLALATSPTSEIWDSILEEQEAVYAALGQSQQARAVLNRRIQRLLAGTDVSRGDPANAVRQLLQAGERVQHSGFPIEGARLLMNVTPHEIDQFTEDLDDDKAIAFRSRFNASLRWARQQMTGEKLVAWLEGQIVAHRESPESTPTARPDADLLLNLNGTTNPKAHDAATLKALRLNSALLSAMSTLRVDETLQTRISEALRLSVDPPITDIRVIASGLALAEHCGETEAVAWFRQAAADYVTKAAARENSTHQTASRIPEVLRSEHDFVCVLIAGRLVPHADHRELVERLIGRSMAAAEKTRNRLVRIAVLNECLAVAEVAGLPELVASLSEAVDLAIAEQIRATSSGAAESIDVANEIRTRLLSPQ
jgi:tetratricopeptide (TPR) repeat protein